MLKTKMSTKFVKVILENARTGDIGDGMIFISNIERAIRIRTEEVGEDAIAGNLHQ